MWEQYFYYDETSKSCLRWAENRYTGKPKRLLVSKGDEVGNTIHDRYWETSVNGKGGMVHRIIWEMLNGPIPEGLVIDHLDGDGFNNKIDNLRVVTKAVNSRNLKKSKRNKTGYTGVVKTLRVENNKEYWYYTAIWHDLDGKMRTKNYSIAKLGEPTAFLLAFSHRQGAMEDLHEQGAGYTGRHGL